MDKYIISTGGGRQCTRWKPGWRTWEELKSELTTYFRTDVTMDEVREAHKSDEGLDGKAKAALKALKQRVAKAKDVRGFVAGRVDATGRRRKEHMVSRSLVTIDIDKVTELPTMERLDGLKRIVYSTHSHTPECPRVRVVLPLDREVTPDEYTAIAHKVCEWIGCEIDMGSTEPERFMYYPACPSDGVPYTEIAEGEDLRADYVLSQYTDWRDKSEWYGVKPSELKGGATRVRLSEQEGADEAKRLLKAENPLHKEGVVGTFCRMVSIYQAIDNYCNGEYTHIHGERYLYAKSESNEPGAIVYEGMFLFSNHSSDPRKGLNLNAFDLVRLVRFGDLDSRQRTDDPAKLKSWSAMVEWCHTELQGFREKALKERTERFMSAVGINIPPEGFECSREPRKWQIEGRADWLDELTAELAHYYDNKGRLKDTPAVYSLIIRLDRRLVAGRTFLDEFSHRVIVRGDLPWRDASDGEQWTDTDDAKLLVTIEQLWGISKAEACRSMFFAVMDEAKNKVNTLHEYIERVAWDGTHRVDTLFEEYLGVPNTELFRAIARKSLVACVARAYEPGVKYDQVTILASPHQGIGKSTILARLAGGNGRFNDSFTFDNNSANRMIESIEGSWIVEIQELQGLRKMEANNLKAFISKTEDKFRRAYGRNTDIVRRSCVFFGTTNDTNFLKDATGNRRFWILPCEGGTDKKPWELSESIVGQIWAEAYELYKAGEPLILDERLSREHERLNREYEEDRELVSELEQFLALPIPAPYFWDRMSKGERRAWCESRPMRDGAGNMYGALVPRETICAGEVVNEFLRDDRASSGTYRRASELLRRCSGWKESGERPRVTHYGRARVFRRG